MTEFERVLETRMEYIPGRVVGEVEAADANAEKEVTYDQCLAVERP